MKPQQVAQYQKAGRGFLITRNSATLADTDYEPIAKEIVDALNKRHAYPKLVEALRDLAGLVESGMLINHPQACSERREQHSEIWGKADAILRELGAIK